MADWLFNEEHDLLRGALRRFVEKEIRPHAEEWEEAGEFPLELYRKMGALGYLGVNLPEEWGGAGGDFLHSIILSEEMAAGGSGGTTAGVTMHAVIAMPALNRFGTPEQKEKFLAPGIKGEKVFALAVTEPDAGSDVAGIRTRAVRDGGEYVINGSKTFITNGVRADVYVVACKTDPEKGARGISQILVEKGTPGFRVTRKLDKLGWRSSDTAELALEDVRVPVSNLMGREDRGFYQIMQGFQEERMIMAVASAAAARQCFERTLKYAKERQAFGRPIGSFQVIAHRFAEMLTEIEAAQSLNYATLWKYLNGVDVKKEVAMCKVLACETAVSVADRCIQIHGGYGYMMEYEVQRSWRDQRIQPIGGGTSEIQKEIISKLLGL